MKNILLIFALLTLMVACETPESVKKDLARLKQEREVLQTEISMMNANLSSINGDMQRLADSVKVLRIIVETGKQPTYVLKLRLKQSHTTLSISQHMKDNMNAIEFELPVDKNFYHNVKIGTDIVDEFRVGSMVFSGSYGSWNMSVIDKEIR